MGIDILGIGGRHFGEERKKVVFLCWGKELFRGIAQGLTVYKEYLIFSLVGKLLSGKAIKSRKRVKEVKRQLYP